MALGLKHPAFHEEREWRIVYIPGMEKSPTIIEDVESIGGVPQIIQKIPLEDAPEKGLFGASIPSLLNRILIGPTEFPVVLYDALSQMMVLRGAKLDADLIKISNIPLR